MWTGADVGGGRQRRRSTEATKGQAKSRRRKTGEDDGLAEPRDPLQRPENQGGAEVGGESGFAGTITVEGSMGADIEGVEG